MENQNNYENVKSSKWMGDYAGEFVTFMNVNDEPINCIVVGTFIAENGKQYIAVNPEASNIDEICLYRYAENEYGEIIFENIYNDAEFEMVANSFDDLLGEILAEQM